MKIFAKIDQFLNSITMYRLVNLGLLTLALMAGIFSLLGFIHYGFWSLLLSLITLLMTAYFSNYLLAKLFKAPVNQESAPISALILFFIMAPAQNLTSFAILILVGFLAMLSKYIFAYRGKHLFNPVAISIFILGLFGIGNAFWWVANKPLLFFTLILSLLIIRKIRRFLMVLAFLVFSIPTLVITNHISNLKDFGQIFVSWPIIFFAGIMLTEPLTTPPTKKIKIIYGALIGLLFGLHFHFGKIYSTPELALIIGNLFGYLFILKQRINLTLLKKEEIAENIFELTFKPNRPLKFKAGQYLEFTLSHPKPDSRGERRYFTIASAPEETELKISIKAIAQGSSFKQTLLNLKNGEQVVASNLDGDFILPKNPNQKICLIAGGIGVTPFRSMIQSLVNQATSNEVVLFYNIKTIKEIAYKDLFESAKQKIKLTTVYVLSDKNSNPDWSGEVGFMDQKMIEKYLKNPKDYQFYLSGPNAMVNNYKKMINQMKVPTNQIKTDYFPGF